MESNGKNLKNKITPEAEHQCLDEKYTDVSEDISASKLNMNSTKRKCKETLKDRLLERYDYYTNTKFGIWIQCTKCNKWRKVIEFEEEHEVPMHWYCSMSQSIAYSCSDPEDFTSEADFSPTKFIPGSIVWARVHGYPWWPGMVEDDPDTEEYYWIEETGARYYNVTFLDEKVTHAWVPASCVRSYFETPYHTRDLGKKYKKTNYSALIEAAEKRANAAITMPIKDRLKDFSFVHRFKGRWPLATGFDSSENEDLSELLKEIEELESVSSVNSDSEQEQVEDNQVHMLNTSAVLDKKQSTFSKCSEQEENEIQLIEPVNAETEVQFNLHANPEKSSVGKEEVAPDQLIKPMFRKNINNNVNNTEKGSKLASFKSAEKLNIPKQKIQIKSTNSTADSLIKVKDNKQKGKLKPASKGKIKTEKPNKKTAFKPPLKEKKTSVANENFKENSKNLDIQSKILNNRDENILKSTVGYTKMLDFNQKPTLYPTDCSSANDAAEEISQNVCRAELNSTKNKIFNKANVNSSLNVNVSNTKETKNCYGNIQCMEREITKNDVNVSNTPANNVSEADLKKAKLKVKTTINSKNNNLQYMKREITKNDLNVSNTPANNVTEADLKKAKLKVKTTISSKNNNLQFNSNPQKRAKANEASSSIKNAVIKPVVKNKKLGNLSSKYMKVKDKNFKDGEKQNKNLKIKTKAQIKEHYTMQQQNSPINETVEEIARFAKSAAIENSPQYQYVEKNLMRENLQPKNEVKTLNLSDFNDNQILRKACNTSNREEYFTLQPNSNEEQSESDSDPFEAE